MIFLLSLFLVATACNAAQDQQKQRHVAVGNIVVFVLCALISQQDQSLGIKRIKFANMHDDCIVQVDAHGSPLEKIWHYQDEPKLFDRWHFDDGARILLVKAQELPTISRIERELERLACLQHLSKHVRKQKKLAQQVIAIKTSKNQIKRAAHHQNQPIKRCQKG